jgi:hypothetical protein
MLIGAIIPIAALTAIAKTATAAAQSEPDYRSRTIYFLLADREARLSPAPWRLRDLGDTAGGKCSDV